MELTDLEKGKDITFSKAASEYARKHDKSGDFW
jgi:hypothetical protein